jgi:hypothetical protein
MSAAIFRTSISSSSEKQRVDLEGENQFSVHGLRCCRLRRIDTKWYARGRVRPEIFALFGRKFQSQSRDLHSILSDLVAAKRSCAPDTLWGMRGIRGLLGIATRRLFEYIRGIEASARATLSKPGTVSLCIGQFFTSLPTV